MVSGKLKKSVLYLLISLISAGILCMAGDLILAWQSSVLEMSLVLVFLFATGKIFHDAMSVRTALLILLASIGLAYNF